MKATLSRIGLAVTCAFVLSMPKLVHAGEVLDRITSRGLMKMATDSNLPPLSFLNEKNELDGFDVDVGKEVARRLGVKLEIVTPEWTVITAGRWNARWDISIGSMTPTTDRARTFDFPAVYYYTPASFVVHKDSKVQKKEELNGKVIGAPSGTTYEKYLNHELKIDAIGVPSFTFEVKPSTVKTLTASAALMDDLRLGDGVRLDGILYALPTLNEAIKKGYPFRIVGSPVFYEPLAIAIEKNDKEFNDKLSEIIAAMKADGTLGKLSDKWFGVDYTKATN
jgi:polar amino acid transport system substrate-binding protein